MLEGYVRSQSHLVFLSVRPVERKLVVMKHKLARTSTCTSVEV